MYLAQDPSFREQLAKRPSCDVYFENVGGPCLQSVIFEFERSNLTRGMIAHYGEHRCIPSAMVREGRAFAESRGLEVHPLFVGDFVASHQANF